MGLTIQVSAWQAPAWPGCTPEAHCWLQVYWPDERQWFKALVSALLPDVSLSAAACLTDACTSSKQQRLQRKHHLEYEDGDQVRSQAAGLRIAFHCSP